jgi:hypothetical protein
MAAGWNRLAACAVALGLSTIFGIALIASPVSAAGSATTTLHFYAMQQSLTVTSATGQPADPNAGFAVGDHYDGTDLLYVGQHQSHAPRFSASDHVACVITVSSTVAARQTCSEQFAIGSAMLLATNVTVTFNGRTASIPINGGTGRYKNARGTLVATQIATSGDTDNTFTLTGVASGPTSGPPSSGRTLPFYAVQESFRGSTAVGKPRDRGALGDGDSYDSTDRYYAGNRGHHASSFSGSDHLACTFTGMNTQTCNSQIAIGGSLLLLNNVTEPGSGTTVVTAPITAGTGAYQNVRGTFESGADTVTTDVTITLTG